MVFSLAFFHSLILNFGCIYITTGFSASKTASQRILIRFLMIFNDYFSARCKDYQYTLEVPRPYTSQKKKLKEWILIFKKHLYFVHDL